MTYLRTILIAVAALSLGSALGGVGPVHAQLGTGSTAIGRGGEAIGQGAPETASEGPRSAATRAVGACVTNRTAFRTQENGVSTTSEAFVLMPNTHYPVAHAAGCLIVDFAGEVVHDDINNRIFIRAFIIGVGAAGPSLAVLGYPSTTLEPETRSMRFVFPNVPAGTHTVRIEWATETDGNVTANRRTLTIQYR